MNIQTQAIETTNLLSETLAFLASKPFHYDDEEIFQLTESVEHGTLQKRGNSYVLSAGGSQIELKPHPVKSMWDIYSKKAESGVSEEQAKKIAKRRQALKTARETYGINKAKEQMIIACGYISTSKKDGFAMIFDTPNLGLVLALIHMEYSQERAKSQIFYTQLSELSNYATKQNIQLDKRLDKRGSGSKENVGRKKKEVETDTDE